MITLNCPDCDQQYELDDDMAGKKAACQCGAILLVPKMVDAAPGEKICPECNEATGEESVICVGCGYNFHTRGRMRAAETRVEPEDDSKIMLVRRLIKPVILMIIAVVAAVIVYNMFFVKHYGISSANPIGTLASISARLDKYGFVKQNEDKAYIPELFGEGVKKITWKDAKLEKLSKGMYSEKIFIFQSSDNKILAIGANFKGTVASIPGDTGSGIGRFMSSLWKETDLTFPPDYKTIMEGKGRFNYKYGRAEAKVNDICGIWMEYPSDVSILPSSHTMLITYSRFGDVTYKNSQHKSFDIESFKTKIEEKTDETKNLTSEDKK